MSRSIHTTAKHLIRERRFARTDEVPPASGPTELEQRYIQKLIRKTNEVLGRQASQAHTLAHSHITFNGSEMARTVRKRRRARPPPAA